MKKAVVWLTGLSGAGKTTIANQAAAALRQKNCDPIILDGDEIRAALQQHGFDPASRKEHNLMVGRLASSLEAKNQLVLVAMISPYSEIRAAARNYCERFIEVFVSADIETCKKRDPKGLYKKALAGEIAEFTGISAPYEKPLHPELELNTAVLSAEECTTVLLNYLTKHLPDEHS